VLAAQDRNSLPHGPEMLRTAQRGLQLAAELLTLITLPTPTIAVLLGQGTGGAALALLPADRVLAARHAWLSPLAPRARA
jgi:acetyl-CoA carboxylase alpha subunit